MKKLLALAVVAAAGFWWFTRRNNTGGANSTVPTPPMAAPQAPKAAPAPQPTEPTAPVTPPTVAAAAVNTESKVTEPSQTSGEATSVVDGETEHVPDAEDHSYETPGETVTPDVSISTPHSEAAQEEPEPTQVFRASDFVDYAPGDEVDSQLTETVIDEVPPIRPGTANDK